MTSIFTASTAWWLLLIAGLLKIVWSSSMKASEGFTKHLHTGVTLVAAWLSFWLLGIAMKSLPLGTERSGPVSGSHVKHRAGLAARPNPSFEQST